MTREEVLDLFEFLNLNYPTFESSPERINAWLNELQMYDTEDVKKNLKDLMAEDLYSKTPPLLSRIIRGLTPKNEKLNFTEIVYFCQRCHKGFNSKEECDIHFDRCLSIDYVIRESRKWFKKELTRKELFEMSDEEFKKRYNKLLYWLYENTQDESEKTRISFIFNPPTRERAKQFLEAK